MRTTLSRKPLPQRIEGQSIKDSNGCWIWQGSISGVNGYGTLCVNSKQISAHRASYLAFKGEIPSGLFVCHTCDVKRCVNPDHLYAGTPKQNMADCISRNRDNKARGERQSNAKLTAEAVRKIRASKERNVDLAKFFGVDKTTISQVRSRTTWKHV